MRALLPAPFTIFKCLVIELVRQSSLKYMREKKTCYKSQSLCCMVTADDSNIDDESF